MNEFNLELDTEKFDVVRRKLSFDKNNDLNPEQVIQLLVDEAYSKCLPKKRVRVGMDDIMNEVQKGTSTNEVAKKLNISMSTVFRAKKLSKLQ